jgi:hypothetical protein
MEANRGRGERYLFNLVFLSVESIHASVDREFENGARGDGSKCGILHVLVHFKELGKGCKPMRRRSLKKSLHHLLPRLLHLGR